MSQEPASAATSTTPLARREFMMLCSAVGLGGTALPAVLWERLEAQAPPATPAAAATAAAPAQAPEVTKAMMAGAEAVMGLEFTDSERDLAVQNLNQALRSYTQMREVTIPNGVPPALIFNPVIPGLSAPSAAPRPTARPRPQVVRPGTDSEVAFMPVHQLAELVRTKQVSSEELTRLYLDRLKRYNATLIAVVNLTEERALAQARTADREIAAGRYKGPLHGIPWGGKDLLAVPGYPTTWGSPIFKDQMLTETAAVVERLDAAGAVLVAKTSLGEFASGDVWFGGMTRNPWNPEQGSSGSSAGSASTTVAGCVGFSIGTETLGSIVSPSTRCGASGLRPTFGRVPRTGAMALSWSMDKLGPICRSVEDCALVFSAIQGPDGKDLTVMDRPFVWDSGRDVRELRVGYLKAAFDQDRNTKAYDDATLDVLRGLGINLIPISIPSDYPLGALRIILNAEAGAAFDEITRSGKDDQMVRQVRGAWPNTFRSSRFIPAVEYIQANRIRTMVMQQLETVMAGIDCFVTPSFGGNVLLMTNLTGHPAVVLPNGFTEQGTPVSISFIGKLFGDSEALLVANAYQQATDFHLKHPAGFV